MEPNPYSALFLVPEISRERLRVTAAEIKKVVKGRQGQK